MSSTSSVPYKHLNGLASDFLWQIENFSMCPHKKGEALTSASFTVDSLDQSEFRLILYPRGKENDAIENVSCFIECVNQSDFSISIEIVIKVNIFSESITKQFHSSNGNKIEFTLLHDRRELARKNVLPNDVLTISCFVTPEYRAYIRNEVFSDISKEFGYLFTSGKFSDLVIIGPGKEKLPVHKAILAVRCAELVKLAGLKNNPVTQVALNYISFPALVAIFSYIYTGNLQNGLSPKQLNEVYEMAKMLKMDDLKRGVFPIETSTIACTTIKVHRRSILWVLSDIQQRMETKNWPIRTFVDLTLGRFIISLYVKNIKGYLTIQIDLYCHFMLFDSSVLVKCTVIVDHGQRKPKHELCSGEHLFESQRQDSAMFSMKGDHDLLYEHSSSKQYSKNIGLVLKFALSNPLSCGTCRKVEVTNTSNKDIIRDSYQRLSSDMDVLFRDSGTFSDLGIKLESGKTFLSHKSILSARSVVLCELIEQVGVDTLDLGDMSEAVAIDMLRYIYCGKINDIDLEHVHALYAAASKYKVHGLMKRCAYAMKSEITNSSVYGYLLLADEHQDENLFDILLDFILLHQKDVISSENWKILVHKKPRLASKILEVLSAVMVQNL